ncbi:MAG TPA: hypothetical protein VMV44_03630 [Rectinemataceae bacterium]|nr:hypothetical protein [Rectinemataceae bacterium]
MNAMALSGASALLGLTAGAIDALLLRRAVGRLLRDGLSPLFSLGALGARIAIAILAFLPAALAGEAAALLACALGFAAGMAATVALKAPRLPAAGGGGGAAASRKNGNPPGGTA